MCGRTSSHLTADALRARVRASRFVNQHRYRPSYNIGPASNSNHPPVLVRDADGARELRAMRWGIVPSDVDDVADIASLSLFNARLETLWQSALWRGLLEKRQRCVVVVSGFFEWTNRGRADSVKQPHHVRRRDGGLLYLAGLYDVHVPSERVRVALAADAGDDDDAAHELDVHTAEPLHSFTVITMRASKDIRFLHDRMPAILQSDAEVDLWLNSTDSFASLARILRQCPVDLLEIYQVPPLVNQLANKDAQCVMPTAEHARSSGIAAFFKRADVAQDAPGFTPAPPLSPDKETPPLRAPANDDDDDDDDDDLKLALQLSREEQAASASGKRKQDDRSDDNNSAASTTTAEQTPKKSKKFDFAAFVLAANAPK